MSKITLRRASKIRNKVEAQLKEIRAELQKSTTVEVNVTDTNVAELISAATTKFGQQFARYSALSNVYYELRTSVGVQNSSGGVNETLARIAAYNSQRDVIRQLVDRIAPALSVEQVNARLALAKEQLTNGRGYGREDVDFPVLPQETIDGLKAEDKRISLEIDTLHDGLERLNSTVVIDLSDAAEAILSAERLL